MKLMTFNILNGGQDSFNYDRLNKIIEVINLYNPDILAIQEAKYFQFDGLKNLFKIENATGLRGIIAFTKTGQNLVLFCKKNSEIIEYSIDNDHFYHAMIKVKFKLDDGKLLTVIATHLCPHGGENRLREVLYLTNYARSKEHVVLMGDLNSLTKEESTLKTILSLPSHYRFRHYMPSTDKEIDTRAIETLEISGFYDLYKEYNNKNITGSFSAPTKLVSNNSEFSKMRVDYIFGTQLILQNLLSCEIFKNKFTDYASDHYPVITEIDLNLK